MLKGLMQDHPLMISDILRHAESAHPEREIVSREVDGLIWGYDYTAMAERVRRCANLLKALGVSAGERVSSLAWNTHRHMELFFAVPGSGAILHTANPRLSDEHIAYTINHAGSRILLVDANLTDLVERLRDRLDSVKTIVLLGGESADGFLSYERLIAGQSSTYEWPLFDEKAGAFLCYTSGTTGDPKGVLYTHRSVVLHALAAGLTGALGFTAFDCIMPCQSLYHATAWGLPFVAAINGCKVVLPGNQFDGQSLQELIHSEGVTFSGGVPTIWTMYLEYLERTGEDVGSLRQVVIGGSAVPRSMAEVFETRYGVTVRQLWGMTETSPLGVVATPTPKLADQGEGVLRETIWGRQGRLQFGIQVRIIDEEGVVLPADGQSAGALQVRGPWVVERYYRAEASALNADGWFDTGDIATVDEYGFVRITDRKKDVIKSGGEWISSIDIENVAAGHPAVSIAAVIGVYHPKWEERPILIVEANAGSSISEPEILRYLEPHMARWWLPDRVIFAPIPLTSTGKIDKRALRDSYRDALRPSSCENA